jgi:hypothetical protein
LSKKHEKFIQLPLDAGLREVEKIKRAVLGNYGKGF